MTELLITIFALGFTFWIRGVDMNHDTEKIIGSIIVLFGFILNIVNAVMNMGVFK